jgi:hypothetical protein
MYRTSYFGAWLLAVLLVAIAGCDDDPSGPPADTVAPTVSSTNPVDGATGVAVITASFSEAMNASTITTATFTVSGAGPTPVTGTVAYSASTDIARFTPTSALAAGTAYTATITTGAKDVAGNALASNHVWSFTTSATTGNQAPVVLGGAGAFAVLAGSTVTNTGPTALTGDLGVSPGTAVTGFPPGTLTGAIHAGDLTSAAAMTDLTVAYNDAAGRTLAPVTVAGNLGGLTLPPGRPECRLHFSDGIDAYHDIRPSSGPERWRQSFKRLLAGGDLGDAGDDVRVRGHHHGGSGDHSEYRGDAEWQGTGTDRRGYAG